MEKRTVLDDFLGNECAACGGFKRTRMSHCGICYHRLPLEMQSTLYRRFGDGYEDAFAASTAWLLEKYPRPVPGK
jgi:hypothetical protein